MPRRRGNDEVTHVGPTSGRQYEQQADEVAHSRARAPKPSPRQRQHQSEIARKTPYGNANRRKKTS